VTREFQVLYRTEPCGPVLSILVAAFTEAAAREMLSGCLVLGVSEVRPLLDWNQKTFTMEEAAVYLRRSVRSVSRLQEQGLLPKSCGADPIFTKGMLDRCIAQLMGTKFSELEDAA
jgi:hypothetical protein